jgi:hypothetical protein
VADASAKSLEPAIAAAIEIGSQVRTDDWKGYSGLDRPRPSGRMAARSRCLDPSLTVRCRSTPVPGNLVIAYEPIWAIGTGPTPTEADVAQAHAFIREQLVSRFVKAGDGIRILYGGSVKPSNAAKLMSVANVDGALVGGASLKAISLSRLYASVRIRTNFGLVNIVKGHKN